jgi:hypothetical protein
MSPTPTLNIYLFEGPIFILNVGVEESIVNAPLVSLQSKNTNNAKSEVRFKQLIRGGFTIDSSTPTLRINLNEHPIYLSS